MPSSTKLASWLLSSESFAQDFLLRHRAKIVARVDLRRGLRAGLVRLCLKALAVAEDLGVPRALCGGDGGARWRQMPGALF